MGTSQLIFIISCILLGFSSTAQDTIFFSWGEGLTEYKGVVDTSQYSLEEIEQIHDYLFFPSSQMLTIGSIWEIEQIDTAGVDHINAYYETSINTLNTMRLPEGEFWDSLLILRKRELTENIEAEKNFILALHDPGILYEYNYIECKEYIDALNGTDEELIEARKDLLEKHKLMNCCPENLEREFQEQMASPNRMKYARLEVMTYGWSNCNNKHVYHHEDYKRLQDEFEHLFLKVHVTHHWD